MNSVDRLRRTMTKLGMLCVWANVPINIAVNMMQDTHALLPTVLMAFALAIVPTLAVLKDPLSPLARYSIAASYMLGVSLLVFDLAWHPWQLDMHMAYFAGLAMLSGFVCVRTILFGTAVVAVHHIALNFLMPEAIFPDGAELGRVILHAGIVVMETGILVWLSQQLLNAFASSEAAAAEAVAAQVKAEDMGRQIEETQIAAAEKRREELVKIAGDFESSLGGIVTQLAEVVDVALREADALSHSADSSQNDASSATASAHTVSSGIQSVAAATEELTASIAEISNQIASAAGLTEEATRRASTVGQQVSKLADSADQIGEILLLIQNIAEQINLLALNATIEAARAGEAGKGFAVVAGEVKSLSSQTATATAQITQRITEIQSATKDAVAGISSIAKFVDSINGSTTTIASAVQQQSGATREIAGTAQRVAGGVSEATDSISRLEEATVQTGAISQRVSTISNQIRGAVQDLEQQTIHFVNSLRAA